ncbi:hypothetical protein IW262DRAFT_1302358 [Armillaria fumosa]|nr:hypothetical protein IW262DRAFT_1302358 [Armillaria fumosa]
MAASHMDDADSDLNEDDGTMDINAAAGNSSFCMAYNLLTKNHQIRHGQMLSARPFNERMRSRIHPYFANPFGSILPVSLRVITTSGAHISPLTREQKKLQSDMGRETRDQKDYNRYLSYFECDISGYDVEAFQMALVRQRGLWRARHWYHSSSRQRGYLARVTSSVKAGVCDGLEKVIATLVSKTPMRKSIGARSGEKIYRNLYLLSMFFCCGMGQHPGIQKVRKGIKE